MELTNFKPFYIIREVLVNLIKKGRLMFSLKDEHCG